MLLPLASRWREALMQIADERYTDAAGLYEQIGSQPLAADAHLLATAQARDHGRSGRRALQRCVEAVLRFADKTGANLYRQQAERLVQRSA